MSPKAKQDMIISIIIYVFIGVLFLITGSMLPDSAMFPRMILTLIGIINTASLIVMTHNDRLKMKNNECEGTMLSFHTAKMPLVVFAGTVVYVVLFALTNYFVATGIMLVIFMWVEKVKPRWLIFVITAIYLAFIYYLFVVQLSVRLIQ